MKVKWIILSVACAMLLAFASCRKNPEKLPILGRVDISAAGDTAYHEIPDFSFINQEGEEVTNETFRDKVYVSDFFFTSCPSICPKVKKQMLRIYDKYTDNPNLIILSHSIDTKRDSVPVLKLYSDNLGITADRWHLVTGDKDKIFDIANDYFVSALEDPAAPGGYDHSGRLILVDPRRHIRAHCNGTDPEDVTVFLQDIDRLLREEYGE